MQQGGLLETDFSGIGGVEQFFDAMLHACLVTNAFAGTDPSQAVKHYSACDSDELCREVLHLGRSEHVFCDVGDKMASRASEQLARLRPTAGARKQEALKSMRLIDSYISRRRTLLYPATLQAYCSKHMQWCRVLPGDDSQQEEGESGKRRWCCHMAGIVCTHWSSFGKREGEASPLMEAYHCWSNRRVAQGDDFIGVENSPNFKPSLLEHKLRHTHRCFKVVCSPHQIGWPVHRKRLAMFGIKQSDWVWVGPSETEMQKAFEKLFFCELQLTGDDLARDSEVNERQVLQELAANVRRFGQEDRPLADISVRDYLSPAGTQRYDGYVQLWEAAREKGPGRSFIIDLDQDPRFRPRCSDLLPTAVTHGLMYSLTKRWVFTPADLWRCHGWPASVPQLADFSTTQIKRFLGNGMHLAAMSTFFFFCLSSVRSREQGEGHPSAMSRLNQSQETASVKEEEEESEET